MTGAGFPLLTERLAIRPLATADIAAFVTYRRIEAIARWQGWSTDYGTADAEALVAAQSGWSLPPAGEWMQLALLDRGDNSLCGDIGLHTLDDQPDTYELGFTLAPDRQGQGLAAEGVRCLLRHLFRSAGAHRVLAQTDSRNVASQRLLERVGLRHESRQVDADWFKGEWTTLDSFAILSSEFDG